MENDKIKELKVGMKEHSKNCNSFKPAHYGDARNIFPNEMQACNCDGYHTFDELYEHRIRLYIELCKNIGKKVGWSNIWCSVKHSDGTTFGDWFVLGINKEKGKQITYHLPARFWEEVAEFAEILEQAPEFDGHTSEDVLQRLSFI